MNELHRLSALRALPAIDIHAHYGCWNLPQPQLQSAQAEMPGDLPLVHTPMSLSLASAISGRSSPLEGQTFAGMKKRCMSCPASRASNCL
mgnify:CR=1 FL=1